MLLIEFLIKESNRELAQHYTNVLNTRYTPYDVPIRITAHFVDRINDSRNLEPITISEVADFFSKLLLKRHEFLKQLPEGTSVHVVDLETDITVPLAKINNVIVIKTIMRGEMKRGSQQKIAI
jgi:hypothetical protein